MKKLGTMLAVVGLVAIAADVGALQETGTSITGASCQAENNTMAGFTSRSNYGVQNNSTTADATVWCPIPQTVPSTANETVYSVFAYLWAYDRHPTLDVTCTLYTLNADGNPSWTFPPQSTTGSSNPAQSLSTLDFSNDNPQGAYVWRCVIPRKSGSNISHVATYTTFLVAP
jgi:hypothetical protein